MANVIIGVHGLGNKPPEEEFERAWHAALLEGLVRNEGRTPGRPLDFELAYWADALHGMPLADDREPYVPAPGAGPLPSYDSDLFDRIAAEVLDLGGDLLDAAQRFFGFRHAADAVLEELFGELHRYYSDPRLRRELQDRVLAALRPHLERGDRIMLIGHSMGSIIAYDALRRLEREDPRAVVDHFVTIGSPLGLPHVKYRLRREHDSVRTPANVRRWTNLADRLDPVALDAHLRDDYAANDRRVGVEDELVINSYVSPAGERNFHKSYGYLRAPELSERVRAFI